MEKILINERNITAGESRSQALEAAQVINSRLIPALETIGQDITDAVLKDCLTGGRTTKESYFKSVEADTKATRTPGIKKQLEDAGAEAWERFEQELTAVRQQARNAAYLTIFDGQAVLTPANEEKLAEAARIYITDPAEIAAYKLHNEIAEKLNL